jgi:hypothetical protein
MVNMGGMLKGFDAATEVSGIFDEGSKEDGLGAGTARQGLIEVALD